MSKEQIDTKNCKECLHFEACSKWTDFPKQIGFPTCRRFTPINTPTYTTLHQPCESVQVEEMAKYLCLDYNENCHKECNSSHDCYVEYDVRTLYNAGYRKQEWISVEERLPERVGKYLVATFDRRVGIGNLIDYYCDGELSFDSYKVTHWMPIPEPPKGGVG